MIGQVHKLLRAVTDNTESDSISPHGQDQNTGIFQVTITGTATVKLQGRLYDGFAWHDITSITASDAKTVALFPHMRAVASSVSGTVTAALLG